MAELHKAERAGERNRVIETAPFRSPFPPLAPARLPGSVSSVPSVVSGSSPSRLGVCFA